MIAASDVNIYMKEVCLQEQKYFMTLVTSREPGQFDYKRHYKLHTGLWTSVKFWLLLSVEFKYTLGTLKAVLI